jgi:hypothetical protein
LKNKKKKDESEQRRAIENKIEQENLGRVAYAVAE